MNKIVYFHHDLTAGLLFLRVEIDDSTKSETVMTNEPNSDLTIDSKKVNQLQLNDWLKKAKNPYATCYPLKKYYRSP